MSILRLSVTSKIPPLTILQKVFPTERKITLSRYDYVVEQANIKQRGGIGDALGELLVGSAWLGSTRGVIMHKNHLCSKQFQGALDNQAVVNNRCLHTTLTNPLALDKAVG